MEVLKVEKANNLLGNDSPANLNRRAQQIRKILQNQAVRYVLFGGCTTAVNLLCFWLMRMCHASLNLANFLSIAAAVLFAYAVNKTYVFQARPANWKEQLQLFWKFIGARGLTMFIEMVGVWLLVDVCRIYDMLGKINVQVVVLILNYIFSRFLVFSSVLRSTKKGE